MVYVRLDYAIAVPPTARWTASSSGADIWHLETHHFTALEGNTLVLREVEQLIVKGQAAGAKPAQGVHGGCGYADAAQWIYAQAVNPGDWTADGLITLTELRHIHDLAMSPVWRVEPQCRFFKV